MKTETKQFSDFCVEVMGFKPSPLQLKIYESVKEKKNLVIWPRRSVGKSYLALSIKLFKEKHGLEGQQS